MVTVKRSEDWLASRVGDEMVMMSAVSGDYIGLTETGAAIWDLIAGPISLDDLCARLQDDFDVAPDRCRQDVIAFIDKMAAMGAILREPQSAA